MISTVCMSVFCRILGTVSRPMLPDLTDYPLAAAICGGLFVGVGVGMIVRQGGSSSGDDALALTISEVTKWRLSAAYLFTRSRGSGPVADVYSGKPHRLFCRDRDSLFLADRSDTEFSRKKGDTGLNFRHCRICDSVICQENVRKRKL